MKIFFITVVLCALIPTGTFASDSSSFEKIPVDFDILVTEDENLGIEKILKKEWQVLFHEPAELQNTSPHKVYWLRIDFKEHDLSSAIEWSLYLNGYDEIMLYYVEDGLLKQRTSGSLYRDHQQTPWFLEIVPFSPYNLIADRYLYLRIKHVRQALPLPKITYSTFNEANLYNTIISYEYFISIIPYFLFTGSIAVMMFYSLGIFFLSKDRVFLLYSFYLLALLLYLSRKSLDIDFPQLNYVFNEVIQVVVNIAYLLFALAFINAKRDYPWLYKISRYVIIFLLLIIASELIILSINIFSPFQIYLINFERLLMALFTILGLTYIVVKLKSKISLFIVVGSLCFTVGAFLSLVFVDVKWMMAGAVLEIFIFALGLGFRFQQVEKQKQKMEKEIDQIRLTALKAQMNPHFIFNSLNSIRSYIIVNDQEKASDYLTKFAKLIRLILQYASSDYIQLKDEISALKLYIELEQMRFREVFDFIIDIDPKLRIEKVRIPPLILQPYIENAIWHGLTPKTGEKSLSLTIRAKGDEMICIIKDNGVGRNFKANKAIDSTKKSMALSLTQDRLNLIDSNSGKTKVNIIDIIDGGKPAGTEVRLILPIKEFPV